MIDGSTNEDRVNDGVLNDDRDRDTTARVVMELIERELTIACAESLTGGLLVAELIRVPGASAVVRGGVVAYDTQLKHSLLHVDAKLLADQGPVHPEVACQMAVGVARAAAVNGTNADIGIATTGVAGPDWQGGQRPGTVYIGLAFRGAVHATRLALPGDRPRVRVETVRRAIREIGIALELPPSSVQADGSVRADDSVQADDCGNV